MTAVKYFTINCNLLSCFDLAHVVLIDIDFGNVITFIKCFCYAVFFIFITVFVSFISHFRVFFFFNFLIKYYTNDKVNNNFKHWKAIYNRIIIKFSLTHLWYYWRKICRKYCYNLGHREVEKKI